MKAKNNEMGKLTPTPRSVEGYAPSACLVTSTDEAGTSRSYLPLDEKKRWLHLWAAANDRQVILSASVEAEEKLIPGIGMIRGTATLSIEGEPDRVATAYAAIQNGQTVEYYSSLPQTVMARAESRLLTNAGFNVPASGEDETATPGQATAQPPMETAQKADVKPPEKVPPVPDADGVPGILANPPWAGEAEGGSQSPPEPENKPEPEPMSLEEAMAYPVTQQELGGLKRFYQRLVAAYPKPTVGALAQAPAGAIQREDGVTLLEWLGGRRIRDNGLPVGEVINPDSRLHLAILTVLDGRKAPEADA